jgi:hypothetical protein
MNAYLPSGHGNRTRGLDHNRIASDLNSGLYSRRFSRMHPPPFRTGPYWSAIRDLGGTRPAASPDQDQRMRPDPGQRAGSGEASPVTTDL